MQTKLWLDKWVGEFKRDHTNTNSAERSRKQKDVTTSEIIKKMHDIVLDDPKVKARELAKAASISIVSFEPTPENSASMTGTHRTIIPRTIIDHTNTI